MGQINNRLMKLAKEADDNPRDAAKQAAFLSVLKHQFPHIAVARCESGLYATDPAVEREYSSAKLIASGQESPSVSSVSFTPQFAASHPTSSSGSLSSGEATIRLDPSQLLNVRVVPEKLSFLESTKRSLSRLFWLGMSTAMIIAAFTYISKGEGQLPGMRLSGGVKEYDPQKQTATFDDVKGCDEAKAELQEVVEFLRDPSKFTKLGGKMPKGVLLVGPPGTGKTLLARAVAGEAGVPFLYAGGSEFDEMFVGLGARRIREMFAAARKKAPSIIFIDEIDSLGGKRTGMERNYDRQALNQLLHELDGFNPSEGVIVLAATNFPEALDKALVRPGRFDRQVTVPLPDIKGRFDILKQYASKVKLAKTADLHVIARGTAGLSGADLSNLVNNAAIRAATLKQKRVTMDDLEWARDKALMGGERRLAMTDLHKKLTAYHEGGHALMALVTKGAHPLHKATILPRGQALGLTWQLPKEDPWHPLTKEQLLAHIDVAMGGRVAEELIFGPDQVTTGASSDLESATQTARAMVLTYGMSDKFGFIASKGKDLGGEAQKAVDQEVKRMLDSSYQRTKAVLTARKADLHKLAEALVKNETLDAEQIRELLKDLPENINVPTGAPAG